MRDILAIVAELRAGGVVLRWWSRTRAARIADSGCVLETGELVLEGGTEATSDNASSLPTSSCAKGAVAAATA
ncbi:MAG: hypothetical protein U1F67_23500 [Rubrivivax sp.]